MIKIANPPKSENLFRSAQSQGAYTLAGALADLIDNSITANATRVAVDIALDKPAKDLTVTIWDDGVGMNKLELIEAMRPASKNPTADRHPADLGRFGWGLKSASLSQAERLEVVTQSQSERTYAAWDIDDCNDFEMELEENTEARPYQGEPVAETWTEVRWKNCSRLTEGFALNIREMSDKVAEAIEDLELIFHRYLAGEANLDAIQILVNNRKLVPHDPFLTGKSTPLTDPTPIPFRNSYFSYEAFALPRLNSMTAQEHQRLSGSEGLVKRQGFYVYRNRRLIISGTWFNIEPYRPLNQLIRIKLDIPNDMDDVWRITVDKSDAQLPQDLKRYLRNIVKELKPHSTRKLTNRVFKRQTDGESIWRLTRRAGIQTLEINQESEIFSKSVYTRKEVMTLTNLLQASIPIDLLSQEKPDSLSQVEPERGSTASYYDESLDLLFSVRRDWTEATFVQAALRYKLMPGDESLLTEMAVKKLKEFSND